MARRRQHLLIEHLEGVSWKVLEEYPGLIRDMIRGQAGVYALYRREKLYYVGLAVNLMRRLKQHLRDRHGGKWDRFSVYLTGSDKHMKELESLLLRIVNPDGNKQSGRFARSENLRSLLNRQMTQADADRRAHLIGGAVAKRHQRRKAATSSGSGALAGAVARSVRLKAWRNGWEYSALLRKDGQIRVDGELYESPSAAGKAVLGRNVNGWRFWHLRRGGEWVPLDKIRR